MTRLWAHFARLGHVVEVKPLHNKEQGKPTCCFVSFAYQESLDNAMGQPSHIALGYELKVSLAESKGTKVAHGAGGPPQWGQQQQQQQPQYQQQQQQQRQMGGQGQSTRIFVGGSNLTIG